MKKKLGNFFRMVWKHKIITIIVVLLVMGFGYYGYNKNSTSQTSGGVQTARVERGDINISVTGSGQVYANSQVDLQGVAAGDGIDVISVNVKNDQEVKKGELIAVLDTTDAAKKVRDAQLSLQSALISQKQTEKLYKTQTVEDKWQRQTQEINVQSKRDSLTDAQSNLEDYYVRAPFDGIVTGLSVGAGDSISRDDIIASVITKEMCVKISLNEVDAAKVKEGDAVSITFDAIPGKTMTGSVSKIDTIGQVSQNVVTYNAEISFQSTSELLKPGMSANAEIVVESKSNVLYVPNSAIKTDNRGSYVQIINTTGKQTSESENNSSAATIENKYITTGITDDALTEVVSGLSENDVIVTKMNTEASGSNSSSSSSSGSSRGLFNMFSGPGASRH